MLKVKKKISGASGRREVSNTQKLRGVKSQL